MEDCPFKFTSLNDLDTIRATLMTQEAVDKYANDIIFLKAFRRNTSCGILLKEVFLQKFVERKRHYVR